MSSSAGILELIVFTAVAVFTVPMVVLTFLLALRWRFSRVLCYVGSGFTILLLLPGLRLGLAIPEAGVYVTGLVLSLCVVTWAFPLGLAGWILVRRGFDSERALRYATVSLPLVVVASLTVYMGRYRPGAEVALGYSVMGLVATSGPTGVGFLVGHVWQRVPVGARRS